VQADKDENSIIIDKVLPHMRAGTAKQTLAALSAAAESLTGINARLIQAPLLAQETRVSSGIGDGVALAHLKVRGLAKPCVIFARLNKSVDFDAVDAKPVDLALLLLSPEADGPLHLRRLARLSRMMRDETLRRHLRGTEDADTLHALLTDPQSRRLAA
jgi:PTS system nitrogen regulatory IIA component